MHKITCADCGKEDEVPFRPIDRSITAASVSRSIDHKGIDGRGS